MSLKITSTLITPEEVTKLGFNTIQEVLQNFVYKGYTIISVSHSFYKGEMTFVVVLGREVTYESKEYHGLDTAERVCFYEQDFYVLSNFSSFGVTMHSLYFPTAEHAYHWHKFPKSRILRNRIREATSAHDAFKWAQENKSERSLDWDEIKVGVMREILRAKVAQHEYVLKKLLDTGDRELVENSWRDDYWGWGPNKDGQNMLGKLWMEIREEVRNV